MLERIARELSGSYLLGVESDPDDSDGRSHAIRVVVTRAGVTVRVRRSFVRSSGAADADRTPRQIVAAALQAPILAAGLPVRAVAVPFRDADRSKVQLLVHAEVGAGYVEAQNIAIGFTVTDREGRVVGGQLGVTSLAPAVAGLPSSLPYEAGANVVPAITPSRLQPLKATGWAASSGRSPLACSIWREPLVLPLLSADRFCRSISLIPRWPVR